MILYHFILVKPYFSWVIYCKLLWVSNTIMSALFRLIIATNLSSQKPIFFHYFLFYPVKLKTECAITEPSSSIVVLMSYYNCPVRCSLSTSYNVVQRLFTVDIFIQSGDISRSPVRGSRIETVSDFKSQKFWKKPLIWGYNSNKHKVLIDVYTRLRSKVFSLGKILIKPKEK